MRNVIQCVLLLILGTGFLAGCAAPVEIMLPAKEPLTQFRTLEIAAPQNDVVGKIDFDIVNDIMQNAVEGILDLKHFDALIVSDSIGLGKELSDRVSRPRAPGDSAASVAVICTTIVGPLSKAIVNFVDENFVHPRK